ncbi:hypothetical protein SS50377_22912 [Spironucleus salmonicida]|uniref:Uncharacterized protein n=1 Tax=Spironucleus salmonicida TaxID=348837 RepID=V6LWZ7_9EUKA|nr:hypothetical protein SS50377_22912 [Spironucleus salmonicida]|eukprot:EST48758.1 Hypothetical protein SS50377_11080 [Spironucleus salmonicida]
MESFTMQEAKQVTLLSSIQYVDYISEFKRKSVRNPFIQKLSDDDITNSKITIAQSILKGSRQAISPPKYQNYNHNKRNTQLEYLSDLKIEDIIDSATISVKPATSVLLSKAEVDASLSYETVYQTRTKPSKIENFECQKTEKFQKQSAANSKLIYEIFDQQHLLQDHHQRIREKYESDKKQWSERLYKEDFRAVKPAVMHKEYDAKVKNELIRRYGERIRVENLQRLQLAK